MRSSFSNVVSTAARWLPILTFAFSLGLVGCGDDDRGADGTGTRDMTTAGPDFGPPMCAASCEGGTTCCGTTCVDTASSQIHCGGCGIACPSSQACVAGVCMGADAGPQGDCSPTCPSSQTCCGTQCVNREFNGVGDGTIDSSFGHCNGCNLACNPERADRCARFGGSGPPQCLCGTGLSCSAGSVCVQSGGVTICTNLSTDPDNCGSVGNACAEGESCSGGSCGCGATGAACGSGEACCAGACVNVTTDTANCGACNNVCPANASSCNGGTCGCGAGPACAPPRRGRLRHAGEPRRELLRWALRRQHDRQLRL